MPVSTECAAALPSFRYPSFMNSDEVRGYCVCLPDWGADY